MEILLPIVILVFSAILHEIMHGVVAEKLGDSTARIMGRLTLNPIPHLDPIGSILLPLLAIFGNTGIFFAWAKPVPINPLHFKDPKKDMALTALAGPLTNLLIAIVAAQLLRFAKADDIIQAILFVTVRLNLALAVINLIPIPPLDGSKVLASILPNDLARSYLSIERFGIFILLALLLFPIGGFSLSELINNLTIFSLKFLGV